MVLVQARSRSFVSLRMTIPKRVTVLETVILISELELLLGWESARCNWGSNVGWQGFWGGALDEVEDAVGGDA